MENQQETKKEDIKETIEFIMIAVVYICVLFGMLSVLSIGHSNGYGQSIIINMVILTIPLVICTILHYSSGKSLNKRIKEELGKM